MSVHVCSPRSVIFRRVIACPTCGTQRRMVESVAVWHAPTFTCCTCGDSWDAEEGRYPRPFARGWRQKEAARARRQWDAAPPVADARRMWADLLREEFDT